MKKAAFIKAFNFLLLRECKINIKNLNMEVLVRNSDKKSKYF